jgi:hypothetical protein
MYRIAISKRDDGALLVLSLAGLLEWFKAQGLRQLAAPSLCALSLQGAR